MSWTDERVETLKRMWNEGQSASQIAKELGGVTRNAVIGKVHRLGLSNRVGGAPVPEPLARPDTRAPVLDDGDDLMEADDPVPAAPVSPAPPPTAPAPAPAPVAEVTLPDDAEDEDDAPPPPVPMRKLIITAGQPLPPQPSLNEISPEALAKVTEVEKVARRLTLMELTEKTCKWPVGDPATENFWFCGLPVQQGKPYCEAHVGVAFQPMSARRDRRR
jgi:GcrA cell cycle regulator